MKNPNLLKEIRAVRDWNAQCGVGCLVLVTLDDGTVKETQTNSEAWLLSGHSAVITLEGISGCYSIHRVTARHK